MRKSIRAICASVLVSSMVVGTAFAAPSSQELDKKKDTLEQQKSAKQAEVNQYQSQYTSLVGKIEDLEVSIISTGEEATKVQADLDAAQEKAEKQNEEMRLRIKFMYETGGNAGMLANFLESDDFSKMVTTAEYAQNVHQYDRKKLEEYKDTLEEVKTLKTELDQKLADLESQQSEFKNKKDQVNNLLESARSQVSSLNADIQQAIKDADAAREAEARAAAEKAAAEAAEAAQRAAQQAVSSNASNNASSNHNSSNAGSSNTSSSNQGSSNQESTNTGNSSAPSYEGQGNTSAAQTIVSAAYSQLGVPYVWGGTAPGVGLDCSGLTGYAHRVAGISIPRTSGAQLAAGRIVSNPQPGDICWTPGHVAIYIGGGQMIEAPQPGDVVKISAVRASAYVRYW
ncbi:MAG TPA: C40 family peptidase [Candidatus Dorea intestinavium]|nr:C40 family peptidase [Candidatus Dorea intestinavium]